MDDEARERIVKELEELRAQMQARGPRESQNDITLIEHVEELQALVVSERDTKKASGVAQALERRLLAWEAEHPQVVAAVARVARALENAGL